MRDDRIDRYTGRRCSVCSDPATCRQRMRHRTGYDPEDYRCDECCYDGTGHCHRDGCTPLAEANEVRDLLGVA